MKIQKKEEVSDSSDSNDDVLNSSDQTVKFDRNEKSKILSKKHATSVNENTNRNEEPVNNPEDSGNEFSCEKTLQETTNPNCDQNSTEEIPIKSTFNVDDLTSDDEVYMLQCPDNYNKQDLCDKKIDLRKSKQTISSNGEVYNLELLQSENKFITLAVPGKKMNGSLVKLPFKGHIIIQKDINMPISKPNVENCSDSQKIPFPNDIKVRHPLLGVEWESYINLANEAIKKSKSKKKKKKLKQEKIDEYVEVEQKALKRKHSESEIVEHKKKKKKHN